MNDADAERVMSAPMRAHQILDALKPLLEPIARAVEAHHNCADEAVTVYVLMPLGDARALLKTIEEA